MLMMILFVAMAAVFVFGFVVIRRMDDFVGDWKRGFDEEYDVRRDATRRKEREESHLALTELKKRCPWHIKKA